MKEKVIQLPTSVAICVYTHTSENGYTSGMNHLQQ